MDIGISKVRNHSSGSSRTTASFTSWGHFGVSRPLAPPISKSALESKDRFERRWVRHCSCCPLPNWILCIPHINCVKSIFRNQLIRQLRGRDYPAIIRVQEGPGLLLEAPVLRSVSPHHRNPHRAGTRCSASPTRRMAIRIHLWRPIVRGTSCSWSHRPHWTP